MAQGHILAEHCVVSSACKRRDKEMRKSLTSFIVQTC